MSVIIKIEDYTDNDINLLNPIEAFGAPHGTIYRMYFDGKPSDTYFIGCGHDERPISLWWDDKFGQYRISSESQDDLKAFVCNVKIRECGPLTRMEVKLIHEDYE